MTMTEFFQNLMDFFHVLFLVPQRFAGKRFNGKENIFQIVNEGGVIFWITTPILIMSVFRQYHISISSSEVE